MSAADNLAELRAIASDWHTGQTSALYAFASSGTIVAGLEGEVERTLAEMNNRVSTAKLAGLAELLAYVRTQSYPFTLYHVTNVISEESAQRGDYESSEVSETVGASLREAIEALQSDCWDSIDERDDCLIAYPADYAQDLRTGDHSADTLIIHCRRERGIDRLMACYRAEEIRRRARLEASLNRSRAGCHCR